MPFLEMLADIRKTRERLPEIFAESLIDNGNEITRFNRSNLRNGELSTGESITPEYAESTKQLKGKSIPDLYVTGGFHRSIYVTETNIEGEVFVTSDEFRDGKPLAVELEDKYSSDIYSLQEQQLERVFDGNAGSQIINKIEENGFKI